MASTTDTHTHLVPTSSRLLYNCQHDYPDTLTLCLLSIDSFNTMRHTSIRRTRTWLHVETQWDTQFLLQVTTTLQKQHGNRKGLQEKLQRCDRNTGTEMGKKYKIRLALNIPQICCFCLFTLIYLCQCVSITDKKAFLIFTGLYFLFIAWGFEKKAGPNQNDTQSGYGTIPQSSVERRQDAQSEMTHLLVVWKVDWKHWKKNKKQKQRTTICICEVLRCNALLNLAFQIWQEDLVIHTCPTASMDDTWWQSSTYTILF